MQWPSKAMGWLIFIHIISIEQFITAVTWLGASEPSDYDKPRTALTYDEVYGDTRSNEETIDKAISRIVNKRLQKNENHLVKSSTATLPGK